MTRTDILEAIQRAESAGFHCFGAGAGGVAWEDQMTPEAQRIAIAEACGWTPWEKSTSGKFFTGPTGRIDHVVNLPDYLNDLNAMHEAEKTLTSVLHYVQTIGEVVSRVYGDNRDAIRLSITATAAQRAEAFLRAVGKWNDTK
jgi:hypothetical protein